MCSWSPSFIRQRLYIVLIGYISMHLAHMNITITSDNFIQLVSCHWILCLNIAPSTQFPPHYFEYLVQTSADERHNFSVCWSIISCVFRLPNTALIQLQELDVIFQVSVAVLSPDGVTSPGHLQHFKTQLLVQWLKTAWEDRAPPLHKQSKGQK